MVISPNFKFAGGPGIPCNVFTETGSDLGPSPAGLKAEIIFFKR